MNSPSSTANRPAVFLEHWRDRVRGAVITDLDGTAVHEREGKLAISPSVEAGLAAIHAQGRQVLVNTLRFPLSVIDAFGADWHRQTGAPIPLVSLNGSHVGLLHRTSDTGFEFEELDAFVLEPSEIRELLQRINRALSSGNDDLLIFFYPRDWRQGELIWTPRADRIPAIAAKYMSASQVVSGTIAELGAALLSEPLCMIFVLVDAPEDRLMAYQHTERARFVTHAGVDKRVGAQALARRLDVSLVDSIGAGDAPTDTFLTAVGLAVIVGRPDLGYRGLTETLHVDDPLAFGHFLLQAAMVLS